MKKPVKPNPVEETQWQVEIEPVYTGEGVFSCTFGSVPFQANESTQIYVSGPKPGLPLLFLCAQNLSEMNFCRIWISKESLFNPTHWEIIGEPCGFPASDCSDTAPDCVACFLNNFGDPTVGYESVLMRFWIAEEFLSGLEPGDETTINDPGGINDGGGYLHLSFHSEYGYEVPPPGVTGYHGLYTFTSLDGLYVKKTESGWIIEFNHSLEDLIEHYTQQYEYLGGNKWKVGERQAQPLTVTTNPVHFRTIWTQY